MGTPVAGPGGFSKRTDKAVGAANRSLPNADYGEQAQYQEQMAAAPLANTDVSGMNFSDLFGNPSDQVVPLDAESQLPDVPVTDGADAGPGAGSEVLSSTAQTATNFMASYLPALEFIANQPGSSDAARNLVRQIKGSL
jgi:hypothetical protein